MQVFPWLQSAKLRLRIHFLFWLLLSLTLPWRERSGFLLSPSWSAVGSRSCERFPGCKDTGDCCMETSLVGLRLQETTLSCRHKHKATRPEDRWPAHAIGVVHPHGSPTGLLSAGLWGTQPTGPPPALDLQGERSPPSAQGIKSDRSGPLPLAPSCPLLKSGWKHSEGKPEILKPQPRYEKQSLYSRYATFNTTSAKVPVLSWGNHARMLTWPVSLLPSSTSATASGLQTSSSHTELPVPTPIPLAKAHRWYQQGCGGRASGAFKQTGSQSHSLGSSSISI